MKNLTKLDLLELYESNVLNNESGNIEVLSLSQMIDKLDYGQIAIQYVEKLEDYKEFLSEVNKVHADYVYFCERSCTLKGYNIEEEYGRNINITKPKNKTNAKFVILNLNSI